MTADNTGSVKLCNSCGKDKPDVKWVIDPYIEDVYGSEEWVWLCDDCYQDHVDAV